MTMTMFEIGLLKVGLIPVRSSSGKTPNEKAARHKPAEVDDMEQRYLAVRIFWVSQIETMRVPLLDKDGHHMPVTDLPAARELLRTPETFFAHLETSRFVIVFLEEVIQELEGMEGMEDMRDTFDVDGRDYAAWTHKRFIAGARQYMFRTAGLCQQLNKTLGGCGRSR